MRYHLERLALFALPDIEEGLDDERASGLSSGTDRFVGRRGRKDSIRGDFSQEEKLTFEAEETYGHEEKYGFKDEDIRALLGRRVPEQRLEIDNVERWKRADDGDGLNLGRWLHEIRKTGRGSLDPMEHQDVQIPNSETQKLYNTWQLLLEQQAQESVLLPPSPPSSRAAQDFEGGDVERFRKRKQGRQGPLIRVVKAKTAFLRKLTACDACRKRKVKVGSSTLPVLLSRFRIILTFILYLHSATIMTFDYFRKST